MRTKLIVGYGADVVVKLIKKWLIVGDVGAHCWICWGSLLGMWGLIVGDVVAHCWECGGSLTKMWWLIDEDVVAH